MVTGVPPHLTIASYVAKLEKRLSLQPECPTTLRAIEGVTHLARVGYGCLKLMRDMLNSDVEKVSKGITLSFTPTLPFDTHPPTSSRSRELQSRRPYRRPG